MVKNQWGKKHQIGKTMMPAIDLRRIATLRKVRIERNRSFFTPPVTAFSSFGKSASAFRGSMASELGFLLNDLDTDRVFEERIPPLL